MAREELPPRVLSNERRAELARELAEIVVECAPIPPLTPDQMLEFFTRQFDGRIATMDDRWRYRDCMRSPDQLELPLWRKATIVE